MSPDVCPSRFSSCGGFLQATCSVSASQPLVVNSQLNPSRVLLREPCFGQFFPQSLSFEVFPNFRSSWVFGKLVSWVPFLVTLIWKQKDGRRAYIWRGRMRWVCCRWASFLIKHCFGLFYTEHYLLSHIFYSVLLWAFKIFPLLFISPGFWPCPSVHPSQIPSLFPVTRIVFRKVSNNLCFN